MVMTLYNVPFELVSSPNYGEVIVRSSDPGELLECSKKLPPEKLAGIQLMSLRGDVGALWDIDRTVPVELVLSDIQQDFPLLYKFRGLKVSHPIWVEIPASPGLGKASRVAAALGFGVSFQATQPHPDVVAEMAAVLDFFLHNSTVTAPIEFFSGLLAAFLHDRATTIWRIQNEDPQMHRYVTESGDLLLSKRLPGLLLPEKNESFLQDLKMDLLSEMGECSACEFFAHCSGYFKLPERNYSCKDIKELLNVLKDASAELGRDLGKYLDSEHRRIGNQHHG
jgi:hypothetical protein